jgi:hypothetical protein
MGRSIVERRCWWLSNNLVFEGSLCMNKLRDQDGDKVYSCTVLLSLDINWLIKAEAGGSIIIAASTINLRRKTLESHDKVRRLFRRRTFRPGNPTPVEEKRVSSDSVERDRNNWSLSETFPPSHRSDCNYFIPVPFKSSPVRSRGLSHPLSHYSDENRRSR